MQLDDWRHQYAVSKWHDEFDDEPEHTCRGCEGTFFGIVLDADDCYCGECKEKVGQ